MSLELQGAPQATGAGNWTLNGIENLSGGINNDTLTGDGGTNVLAGNAGNDTLIGGAGNDTLYGDGIILTDNHLTGGSGPITPVRGNAMGPGGNRRQRHARRRPWQRQLDGGGGIDTASYARAGRRRLFTIERQRQFIGRRRQRYTGRDREPDRLGL